MRILVVLVASMLLVNSACGQTPEWVNKFKAIVENVKYDLHQDSLKVLHQTLGTSPRIGRANCVAYAKLAVELAMNSRRNGIVCEAITIGPCDGGMGHRIALIYDSGKIWLVSNHEIGEVKSERDAIEKVIIRFDPTWEYRTLPVEVYLAYSLFDDRESSWAEYGDWEIRDRHLYTKKELE